MTRERILFSIIGVLLGVVVGYVFATNVNQQGNVRRAPVVRMAGELAPDAELPENHPPIPSNEAAASGEGSRADIARLEKAKAEPDNFEAQVDAARVHYQNRRFDEAIQFLMRANKLRPDSYETVVALGDTNFDAGRYEIAEKWYTAALAKNQRDVDIRKDLGLTFLLREPPDLDRAISELRRALAIDPNNEPTLYGMVKALTKKGRFDEAEAMLKRLSEVNPSNQDLAKLRGDIEARRSASKQPATKSRNTTR